MFSREDLSTLLPTLLAGADAPAVSLFLPTHEAGREIRQDPIRFRNLLDGARARLDAGGMRGTDADRMLAEATGLLEDGEFWRHQGKGLAVFVDAGRTLVHRLPVPVAEAVHVDDRFHVRPLLPVLAADGLFYVLAVSLQRPRLFRGTRYGLEPVPLETLPRGFDTLLTDDEPDRTGKGGENDDGTAAKPVTANAPDAPAQAGGGSQRLTTKEELVQYVTQLAAGVDQFLRGTDVPLVLVADERVLGHFLTVNRYRGLVQPAIPLQPDSLGPEEMHARTYALVKPRFEQGMHDGLERFRMLAGDGSGRASSDVAGIVAAAVAGRVEQLFLRDGAECWGRYLPEAARAVLHTERREDDSDLLDLAAGAVIARGGEVFELPAERMPVETPAAALLRY